jgi:hypothetical protein
LNSYLLLFSSSDVFHPTRYLPPDLYKTSYPHAPPSKTIPPEDGNNKLQTSTRLISEHQPYTIMQEDKIRYGNWYLKNVHLYEDNFLWIMQNRDAAAEGNPYATLRLIAKY